MSGSSREPLQVGVMTPRECKVCRFSHTFRCFFRLFLSLIGYWPGWNWSLLTVCQVEPTTTAAAWWNFSHHGGEFCEPITLQSELGNCTPLARNDATIECNFGEACKIELVKTFRSNNQIFVLHKQTKLIKDLDASKIRAGTLWIADCLFTTAPRELDGRREAERNDVLRRSLPLSLFICRRLLELYWLCVEKYKFSCKSDRVCWQKRYQ